MHNNQTAVQQSRQIALWR